jgi:hypothetical protein
VCEGSEGGWGGGRRVVVREEEGGEGLDLSLLIASSGIAPII